MPSSARGQGVLALLIVILAWGLTWPVNKVVLATLSPLWAVTLRSVIATAALFALAAWRGRIAWPPREDWPVLWSITLLHMVGFNLLASWGLGLVPAGRSVVLAYTTPLWVTPGAALLLGEPLTPRRTVGVLVGLAGLAALFNPLALDWSDHAVVLGHFAVLLAALLWAASILHIRAHRWRSTPFALIPWETLLSTLLLAQAYPACEVVGFDYHAGSIKRARERAKAAGIADRVRFEVASATEFSGRHDLVLLLDCLHDMGDPESACRHIRAALEPEGTLLLVEPLAGDRLADNLTPLGRAYYAASTLNCVPTSLSQPKGLALGAQAGEARLREIATRAGFKTFRRALEAPFNLVIEARP